MSRWSSSQRPCPTSSCRPRSAPPRRVAVGETLTIAGFGVTMAGTARGLGMPRKAKLTVTGKPGSLQIRLYDPATRNVRAGLGACTGDSGAPAFDGDGPLRDRRGELVHRRPTTRKAAAASPA